MMSGPVDLAERERRELDIACKVELDWPRPALVPMPANIEGLKQKLHQALLNENTRSVSEMPHISTNSGSLRRGSRFQEILHSEQGQLMHGGEMDSIPSHLLDYSGKFKAPDIHISIKHFEPPEANETVADLE
ncbi:hypothetical protein CHELA20_52898 [Hyphomicrobiales bacterium]|nr:hypothetical protein CHELA41_22027 [Hyphomicrobiales bacterium]CAH1683170.1 hypothetical protein CHELA20_52898 [Hyphomicrobiales bacterium]